MKSSLAFPALSGLLCLLLLQVSSDGGGDPSPLLDRFLHCLPTQSSPLPTDPPISHSTFTQSNSSFSSVLNSYIRNLRFSTADIPKPVAIVAAKHPSHVQAAVVCARYSGLQLRIRSGGHDCEGLSYTSRVPFVILDMFDLRSIEIDMADETAWVQSGASLGELYYAIARRSSVHAFPAGGTHTIGVGGHFTVGGYGTLAREFGLSADNVLDAILVDVNGQFLDRESMGEDLFWGITGGGGESFGVILAWKIKLVRVPEKVTLFGKEITKKQSALHLAVRWQEVAHNLDTRIFLRALHRVVNRTIPGRGRKAVVVDFFGLYLGKTDTLLPLLEQSFPELGITEAHCIEMSWIESTVRFAELPLGSTPVALLERPVKNTDFAKSKSDFAKSIVPKRAIKKVWRKMKRGAHVFMEWNPYGGMMARISEESTPFPHRNGYRFSLQYTATWKIGGEKVTEFYLKLIRDIYEIMAPYVAKGPRDAYLGIRDVDIGRNRSNATDLERGEGYGSKYFKGNFVKLKEVKGRVDPLNFFSHEQSIPPVISSTD